MTERTDLYCVMGHPVAHSRSPWIHARFAELTNQPLRYERLLAPVDGFTQALQQFVAQGGQGCNVTVPFKLDAAQAAHSCSERVALAGAANTLVISPDGHVHADNTDGLGLVADLTRNAGFSLTGKDLLLVGAGGAAAGVLGPLLAERPRSLTVCNRTLHKAQDLVAAHQQVAQTHGVTVHAQTPQSLIHSFDLVINATAASLQGAGIPVAASVLRPGSLAYDMMYGPSAAAFLQWAKQHGAQGRDGLGMLVEQAAASFMLWRQVQPPAAQVLQELRDLLAQEASA